MARGKPTGRYTPGRRGSSGEDGGADRWLTTYGDAITLLMAFFVMLYAMSEIDVEKWQAFVAGLAAPFSNEAGAESLLPAGASVTGDVPAPETQPAAPTLDVPVPMPDAGADQPVLDREQLERVHEAVVESLASKGLDAVASYRYDERGLVVSIGADDVLFATGSTTISSVGREIIATISRALRRFPNDVIVEGHTDNVPLDRLGYSNWNLSTDRAVAVLELLIDDFGLQTTRLGAAGYGEHRPLVSNDTPANRARNRRVDILIVAQGGTDG